VSLATGKIYEYSFLHKLGAKEIISREDVFNGKIKHLDKQIWAAAVDPVGREKLASILSTIQYNGSVAVSGLTGGVSVSVPTTVFPFILPWHKPSRNRFCLLSIACYKTFGIEWQPI